VPSDPLRLLSFEAPAGRTSARLERVALPAERWGWAVSGLALVAWLLLLWRAISVDAKRAARA
jgi:hypothetical protein